MTSETDRRVLLEVDGAVASIVLNRPPLNILDLETIGELNRALDSLRGRDEISVVTFRGAGERAFSAGVEVRDHAPDRIRESLGRFHEVFRRLWRSNRVSVAVVRGHCLGGGCELAASCDLVLAGESARFGQPEIDLGCFPPVAAATFPAALGWRRAAELVLLGRDMSALEARTLGLVNWVVADGDLDRVAAELLASLRAKSPAVLRLTKEALRRGRPHEMEEALRSVEELYLDRLTLTEDMTEGVQAFLEKRKPQWRGR